jgi:hypothetical protein
MWTAAHSKLEQRRTLRRMPSRETVKWCCELLDKIITIYLFIREIDCTDLCPTLLA